MVTKSAVIGIDLGASESYVAYVGKGIVDVVQNEVSKRATSSLVGFTDRERLLGDSALAQIRSNAKNSCRNFKHLLGRKLDSPDLESEHFWSTSKLCDTDDGFCGYDVTYKGEAKQMSATQVTAMYLTKLKEITESWCQAKVADIVIGCPSSYSDVQRQALMDAAKIAGLSVLRIMNEHTATALAYGIYRSNDFDPEKPMTVVFCSMGHSLFSVSVVNFVRGKLTVVAEKSAKVGGRDLDECLMREFGAQFQKKVGCDPLSNKKAAFKLEDAVTKTKKVLSANSEAPCTVECLMEDEDFSGMITRADLEKMCEPAMEKVKAVLEEVKVMANLTSADQIDSVEVVGGGSRVPWVKKMCSEAFFDKDLSTTMNQEESVARGCALQAAILSPLYKVRDFKVEDVSPYAINVGWMGSSADAEAAKEDDGDTEMAGGEGEYKTATVFPEKSLMNVLKMLTFYRNGPFEIKTEIANPDRLLPGTPKELGCYKVELPSQASAKKVKVKAKLTLHGTFNVEGAQLVEEEEYEEVVKEKRELPPEPDSPEDVSRGDEPGEEAKEGESGEKKEADGDAPMPDQDGDAAMPDTEENGDKKEGEEAEEKKEKKEEKKEKKPKEPKFEWVEVTKKKKRTKRTDLKVTKTGVPGLSDQVLQQRMDEEFAMQAEMREIIETDEKRNDLESYIFNMRAKVAEDGEYGAYISPADREKFNSDLMKTEDWLYDTFDATKTQYIDKVDELKVIGDPVAWRCKEAGMREDWVKAVAGTVANYRAAAEQPGDKYGHIAAEKLAKITAACDELEKWLTETKAKQETVPKYEKPVLICADMEKKNQDLAKMADEILKEPKPAPPKVEKKAEEPAKEEAEEAKPEEPAKEEEAEAAPADDADNMDVD